MALAVDQTISVLRPLEWDSAHFEMPVAEIISPDLSDEELRDILMEARTAGFQLVYWQASPGRCVTHLLPEFGGAFINHRVRFQRELNRDDEVQGDSETTNFVRLELLPHGEAPPWLEDLAILAGHSSRFLVDHRLDSRKFRDLYRTWAKRSALGELADRVWYAVSPSHPDQPAGFITVSAAGDVGRIGLIAVGEQLRGRGVGSGLIQQAHTWLRNRNATSVSVVTQLENDAACRLYSRCGYRPIETRQCFHFLL